jgi:transcriptional regulator GlxA family with amidase domain
MSLQIAFLLFHDITALDVIGPYEALSRLPGAQVLFVGKEKGEYCDHCGLKLVADYSIDEITSADVLVIPGGFGIDKIFGDQTLISWIQRIDASTQWTVSVCSGSLLLAAAGLLDGKQCTTNWMRKEQLKQYGVLVVDGFERYVRDGKIITAAGVSAGIDMALYLVSCIANEQTAKIIQLSMEYDPRPPFDCGTPDKASIEILSKFRR